MFQTQHQKVTLSASFRLTINFMYSRAGAKESNLVTRSLSSSPLSKSFTAALVTMPKVP